MNKRIELLILPLKVIRVKPFPFWTWVLAIPFVGLAGLWLPVLLEGAKENGGQVLPLAAKIIYSGTIASVSVALLIEGLQNLLVVANNSSNHIVRGMRGIVFLLAAVLLIVLIAFLVIESTANATTHIKLWCHIAAGVVAFLAAAYLFCFRFPDVWEPDVAAAVAEEEQEIASMAARANQVDEEGGVKL